MQTLGLTEPTPRSDGRLKALFWPTIRHDGDFDHLTEQGFWVCFIVSMFTLAFTIYTRHWIEGGIEVLFFFLAAMGVRQRSTLAAMSAFTAYLLGTFVVQRWTGHGFSLVRLFFLSLLLANVRGIWLSTKWEKDDSAKPTRLNQTIFDKISDQLPPLIWPKTKWLFAVLAAIEVFFASMLLTMPLPTHP